MGWNFQTTPTKSMEDWRTLPTRLHIPYDPYFSLYTQKHKLPTQQ